MNSDNRLTRRFALLAVAAAVVSSAMTALAMRQITSDSDSSLIPSLLPAATSAADSSASGRLFTVSSRPATEQDFTTAAESTINGVVSIKSYVNRQPQRNPYGGGGGGFFSDPFFEYFFGSPRQQAPQQQEQAESAPKEQQLGLGSGVIISKDGYIVTNNHVIGDADRLEVTLNDNRTFDATVIGGDATTDLALIKIDAKDLPVIPLGDSDALKVGEWVLAVGNPFGFTSTVTTGIVSAKARSIGGATHQRSLGIESYIQTDAAVNPGNSGGALVNLKGELVGINTAIYSQTGNYAGYSFAIPVSIVEKVASDLRQYGAVQRAMLGVNIADLTASLAKEHGITAVTKGVYVGAVQERSSAKEAGLQEGDVIVAIDNVPTDNVARLQEQVAKHRPGDKIMLTYVRDNKHCVTSVKLLNPQGNTTITKPTADIASLGCEFKDADEALLKQLGLNAGVQVNNVKDGAFKDGGVRNGFIIVSVNDTRISSVADLEKLYSAIHKSDSAEKVMILRGYYPTGKRGIYAIDLSGE